MERKLILIAGIPGTGKTTTGNFLAEKYGYIHIDMEEDYRTSKILENPEIFINKLFSGNSNIVVTWGFSPDQETIDVVNKLMEYGFGIFWFTGDRQIARGQTVKRGDYDEKVLQTQMVALNEWNVPKKINARIINVFNEQGNFKNKTDIAKEIGVIPGIPTNLFRPEKERKVTLTQNEQEKILQIDPSFQSISEAIYFDNYDLPCPVRVSVTTKDNKVITVVLRKNRHGDVRKEIQILLVLKEFGLPVPEILSKPFEVDDDEYAAIYSLLPGENLQKLSMRSEKDLGLAKELLVQAVAKLMDATNFIKKHEVAKILPSITLLDELKALNTEDNLWLREKIYQIAFQKLQKILPNIKTPLVLSNGDYQPGNFLAQDGKITGFLDFESPSFQDPMMGFVKYPIYDLDPLGKTDIIKVFLNRKGFSEVDFNYRLVLGCLKILKKEIPVSGGDKETQGYRSRVLNLLKKNADLIH